MSNGPRLDNSEHGTANGNKHRHSNSNSNSMNINIDNFSKLAVSAVLGIPRAPGVSFGDPWDGARNDGCVVGCCGVRGVPEWSVGHRAQEPGTHSLHCTHCMYDLCYVCCLCSVCCVHKSCLFVSMCPCHPPMSCLSSCPSPSLCSFSSPCPPPFPFASPPFPFPFLFLSFRSVSSPSVPVLKHWVRPCSPSVCPSPFVFRNPCTSQSCIFRPPSPLLPSPCQPPRIDALKHSIVQTPCGLWLVDSDDDASYGANVIIYNNINSFIGGNLVVGPCGPRVSGNGRVGGGGGGGKRRLAGGTNGVGPCLANGTVALVGTYVPNGPGAVHVKHAAPAQFLRLVESDPVSGFIGRRVMEPLRGRVSCQFVGHSSYLSLLLKTWRWGCPSPLSPRISQQKKPIKGSAAEGKTTVPERRSRPLPGLFPETLCQVRDA